MEESPSEQISWPGGEVLAGIQLKRAQRTAPEATIQRYQLGQTRFNLHLDIFMNFLSYFLQTLNISCWQVPPSDSVNRSGGTSRLRPSRWIPPFPPTTARIKSSNPPQWWFQPHQPLPPLHLAPSSPAAFITTGAPGQRTPHPLLVYPRRRPTLSRRPSLSTAPRYLRIIIVNKLCNTSTTASIRLDLCPHHTA